MRTKCRSFTLVVLVTLAGCSSFDPEASFPDDQPTIVAVPTATAPPVTLTGELAPLEASNIAQVWANDGGDKVTRDELRATTDPASVGNALWDGTRIALSGARNEVVSFNLVLEAPDASATNVTVSLSALDGPDGSNISTRAASGDDLFNYVERDIELFYVRYLEIEGISTDIFFAGYDYDERHIPARCRRPYDAEGEGQGDWSDRPCLNLFYPEIAVPLELHTPFSIEAGSNQSIWGDIYIPKDAPAGDFGGVLAVTEGGRLAWQVPVNLRVYDFTLPDLPSARTMVYLSAENINDRYLGVSSDSASTQTHALVDRHFQLAHRHKISLIDDYTPVEQMGEAWLARLNGQIFTPEHGYEGVGVGVGNNVYSIGTYGDWFWQDGGQAEMRANSDAWVEWFDAQVFATPTDYFLYLIDESDEYRQIERWANWIEDNPGPGNRLLSMATMDLPVAAQRTPSLDIPASWPGPSLADEWAEPSARYAAQADKRLFMYNSNRPMTGSFAIEDEGVALRQLAWVQYKFGVERWFYWESTYYDNFQGEMGYTNVFQQAHTYGNFEEVDDVLGQTGWNYLNGDGVLFYPGTDTRFAADSYGVQGPFASLRLKHWRRGLQDVDYLVMAAEIDPVRTAEIVQAMVPQALWEVGVSDVDDPTWVLSDISWPTNPDVWEAARAELAAIIEGAGVSASQ